MARRLLPPESIPEIYTCANLQSLIAAQGFVFISQPVFGDFVVSGPCYCGSGQVVQLRSVPTLDNDNRLRAEVEEIGWCAAKA